MRPTCARPNRLLQAAKKTTVTSPPAMPMPAAYDIKAVLVLTRGKQTRAIAKVANPAPSSQPMRWRRTKAPPTRFESRPVPTSIAITLIAACASKPCSWRIDSLNNVSADQTRLNAPAPTANTQKAGVRIAWRKEKSTGGKSADMGNDESSASSAPAPGFRASKLSGTMPSKRPQPSWLQAVRQPDFSTAEPSQTTLPMNPNVSKTA